TGIASAQRSRDATIAPAAFAKRTASTGSQPESSPWQRAPPNASPAPSPQTTLTGTGGTSVLCSAVATSTPSPPSLTTASSSPRPSSRSAASSGSALPTAISHSRRLPTAAVAYPSAAATARRAAASPGQNVGR